MNKSFGSFGSFGPFGPFGPLGSFVRSNRSIERAAFGRSERPEHERFERLAHPERSERLSVECVRDHWGFTLLRPHWNELLGASAAENPFLTWEWLHTWWTQLGEQRALHLVVARSGEQIVAIAPFHVVSGPLAWFSRLEFLGTGYAGSDYLDVIARRGYEKSAAAALARYLRAARLALRLEHVRPDAMVTRVARQLEQAGWTCTASPDGTCPVVALDGHTFDSYLATLGPSHRANFRRRLRALEQRFTLRFERAATEAERRELLERLMAFHRQRWSDRGGSTAFLTPAVRAFQDEVTRRAFARGVLRMYALRLDGGVAAVMYGFAQGGRFYFYQHGFDERFQDLSVGLVLMGLTIRAALDDGAREFDMLWGVEPYKFLWARDSRPLQRLELFPVHIGGAIHRRALTARRGARTLARRVLSLGAHLWS